MVRMVMNEGVGVIKNEKSATLHLCKLLIFLVDQVGLEPTTSRL